MGESKQQAVTKTKKKTHSFKYWKQVIATLAGVAAIAVSSGIVFGVTAAVSKNVHYVNIKPDDNKIASIDYGAATPKKTSWSTVDKDGKVVDDPTTAPIWLNDLKLNDLDFNNTYGYAEIINDGSNHQILDQSFNQGAYQGLVNWVHQKRLNWQPGLDMQVKMTELVAENQKDEAKNSAKGGKPTSDSPSGFINTYKAVIGDGVKSLVLPGFNHLTPLGTFAKDPVFAKAGYIFIDGTFSDVPENNEHVASIMFRSDEASFLVGLAACQYLEDNYDKVYSKVNNGQLAIGCFGGTAIPTVTIYMGGLEWGIWAYNTYVLPKLIKQHSEWTKEEQEKHFVKFISLGKSSSYFSGTFTVGDARLIVQQLLAYGADMILPVAGPQTADACSEIVNQNSPAKVIGVDTDQENGDLGSYKSGSSLNKGTKVISFSAQKDIAYITSMVLQASAEGKRGYWHNSTTNKYESLEWDNNGTLHDHEKYAASAIGSYGYTTVGNVDNNAVKISHGDNYDPSKDPNYQGDGWNSLIKAVTLMFPEKTITDYATALNALMTETPYSVGGKKETLFEMLTNNMKFIY